MRLEALSCSDLKESWCLEAQLLGARGFNIEQGHSIISGTVVVSNENDSRSSSRQDAATVTQLLFFSFLGRTTI